MDASQNKVIGQCACAAIKFLVTLPPRFCVHCHCRYCRLAHGAPVVTWMGIPSQNFRLSGREHLRWYLCSKDSKTGFCGLCGTTFLFLSTRWPDEVHVTRANIYAKADIAPIGHIYFDQRVEWFPFEDSLPHLGGRSGTEMLQETLPDHLVGIPEQGQVQQEEPSSAAEQEELPRECYEV